jgi:ferredoxin
MVSSSKEKPPNGGINMKRRIIRIDEEKCNGCGACATACHEGAIEMIGGKAKLTREDYCDGLGDCLPACPTDAISFEEREAPAYNEEAVRQAKQQKHAQKLPCGCPGTQSKAIRREAPLRPVQTTGTPAQSQLSQWPVQIKLVPVNAPYFEGANLLIAADCTAYAYGNFQNEFIRGRITLIGCPKLDEGDYADKLTQIIANNDIRSVTIVRMEVPCCGGIENAAKQALLASGKFIPWRVVTVTTDENLIE